MKEGRKDSLELPFLTETSTLLSDAVPCKVGLLVLIVWCFGRKATRSQHSKEGMRKGRESGRKLTFAVQVS